MCSRQTKHIALCLMAFADPIYTCKKCLSVYTHTHTHLNTLTHIHIHTQHIHTQHINIHAHTLTRIYI